MAFLYFCSPVCNLFNRALFKTCVGENIASVSFRKKRKRQYLHIKESELKKGVRIGTAKRIAAATTNKTRRRKGETK